MPLETRDILSHMIVVPKLRLKNDFFWVYLQIAVKSNTYLENFYSS